MSAAEFGLHLAEYQRQPWGDLVVEMGAGMVASTLANIHRKQGSQPFSPIEFMPFSSRQQESEPEVRTDGASFIADVMGRVH